ncbi:MAG: hypothetical protein K5837_03830 [Candidatus Saccharibacteria bacterium]|nr:hypothetical protein [Candidatus Saccharibacteria bacterium]
MKKHIDRMIDRIGTDNIKYMTITIPPYVVIYFILLDVLGHLTQFSYNATCLLAGIPAILLMAYRLLNKPNNWKPSRLMHLHTAAIWAIIFAHRVHNTSGGIVKILALGIPYGFLVLFHIIAAIATDTSNSTNNA